MFVRTTLTPRYASKSYSFWSLQYANDLKKRFLFQYVDLIKDAIYMLQPTITSQNRNKNRDSSRLYLNCLPIYRNDVLAAYPVRAPCAQPNGELAFLFTSSFTIQLMLWPTDFQY